jgi:polar amino acid transport system substrate-binding protein
MNRIASIALAAAIAAATPVASHAIEALTSNIPPFSIENGSRAGFMREILVELAKRVGTEVPIVYGKSWPQSQEAAKTKTDTLIFPLSRNPSRDADYQWLIKVMDFDIAFATAPGKPVADNDTKTRALARIGVREGAPMEKALRGRGYTNLVVLKTSTDCVKALHDGKIDAWYAPAPEIAFNWIQQKFPDAPVFGLKLQSAPLYIAASRNTPGIDADKWRKAFADMEKDGTRAKILAAYGVK